MKVLIVDDDDQIQELLRLALSERGYIVDVATDGQEGWELAESLPYDLILLDVMLPKLDGITFCRQLRVNGCQALVLLVSAKGHSGDRIAGLDAGADDYIVKPIALRELESRIQALLRRRATEFSPILEWGDLKYDPQSCRVSYQEIPIELTAKELALLDLFMRNNQQTFSHSAILTRLWSLDRKTPNEETVRAHVKRLRHKLRPVGAEDIVETVYGMGYRLNQAFKTPKMQTSATPVLLEQSSLGRVDRISSVTSSQMAIAGTPSSTTIATSVASSTTIDMPLEKLTHVLDTTLPVVGNHAIVPTSHQPSLDYYSQLTDKKITTLWQENKPKILDRLDIIDLVAQALQQGVLEHELREKGQRECHRLIGSLGMLGLTRAAEIARRMEVLLQPQVLREPASGSNAKLLQDQLLKLRSLITETDEPQLNSIIAPQFSSASTTGDRSRKTSTRLLVIDQDVEFVDELINEATQQGFQTVVATDPKRAKDAIIRARPDVILLNLEMDEVAGMSLLHMLSVQLPQIPVLVLAPATCKERVTIARQKNRLLLQKPVAVLPILDLMERAIAPKTQTDAKILIVDDDLIVLRLMRSMLEGWGFQVTTLSDPLKFWKELNAVQPDFLILDVQLPDIDGIKLCQMLRNDRRWSWLPIMVLTGSQDNEVIQQIFAAGADDYVSKPVVAPDVITRILNRMERTRLLRSQAELDGLTQVLNRQESSQRLVKQLKLAQRLKQNFCLSILQVDQLKRVNQTYGHSVGDELLRHFADILRQEFRSEDIIARWTGAEFVVGLFGLSRQDGAAWLAEISQSLQWRDFSAPDGEAIALTFKAGTAQFPEDGTDLAALYSVAGVTTQI
jgi:diguanylate cyclase (GGDEF)-like protein